MRKKLISLLESFGYPVHLQGSLLSVDNYPDSFLHFGISKIMEIYFMTMNHMHVTLDIGFIFILMIQNL